MTLRECIMRVRQAMPAGQYVNEASISTGVILPILHELGWPVFDPTIVAPEFTLQGRRVDYALCHPRTKPAVFIEVKQPGKSEGADRQLFEYAFHLGIPVAVLTDGREWHFYLPAGQGQYQDRRVYKLDLIDRQIEESESRLARYLSYSAVVSGAAYKAAQDDYNGLRRDREIADTISTAWRKLLEEKDELLVDLVAEQVESLCGYKPDPDTVTQFLQEQVRTSAAPKPPVASPRTQGPARPPQLDEPADRRKESKEGFGFSIRGARTTTKNGRETLIAFFQELARRDPSFLERFAALPRHGRSRRFLSHDRSELYPGRDDLAAEYSYEVVPGWWLGTNYGSTQIRKIIGMACDVAGLKMSTDVVVEV